MDHHQWKPNDFSKAVAADFDPSDPELRQRQDMEGKDSISARKAQKADLSFQTSGLRKENASLKADITNLNIQYQQRLRFMFPWTGIDPSVVVAPPYSYPVPLPVPTGPFAMRPSLQLYPVFGNHNPAVVANPYSTFMPYSTTAPPPMEQPSLQRASSFSDLSAGEKKGKQTDKEERSMVNQISSSQYHSSQGPQDNASNNIDDISKCNK
ncbi:Calcium dependent protein kinase 16 [Hibiscus syriacus]|uniref:Calcium dependent protein kinase 16 n=1 Tax=Hibiscus syriacus TaxID=106335 RepID=A0A6A2WMT3_HIBSY|nr:Calcium dependent protein kinase 16 [Hibiscus syriacus]